MAKKNSALDASKNFSKSYTSTATKAKKSTTATKAKNFATKYDSRRIDKSSHTYLSSNKIKTTNPNSTSGSSTDSTSGSGVDGSGGSGGTSGSDGTGTSTSNAVITDVTGNAIKSQNLEPIENKANDYSSQWKLDNVGWNASKNVPDFHIYISYEKVDKTTEDDLKNVGNSD